MPARIFPAALLTCAAAAAIAACTGASSGTDAAASANQAAPNSGTAAAANPACDPDNGGLTLPAGYCAKVFADNIGHARHLVVAANGDVYVNTWTTERTKTPPPAGGYIVALRDADRDGRAETIERFGAVYTPGVYGGGTGIGIHGNRLYVETDDQIVRYALGDTLTPGATTEVVVRGLPRVGDHQAHAFVITPDGRMFVNSGSQTNACQVKNRTLQSPGQRPCAELELHAGIWRYQADEPNQMFAPRERFATGLRNTLAMAIDPATSQLFAVVHGRDQLSQNWPKLYTAAENSELPAEKLVRVVEGRDYGWPMCYWDAAQPAYVLAPEYGGDGGESVRGCEAMEKPFMSFPAHWAPEAMVFSKPDSTWNEFRDGAFVSFHGSWDRVPTQSGFLVAFVPFVNGQPNPKYIEFATGFAGAALPVAPDQALYRPMGLAIGPDSALYVSDDVKGRIWKISRNSR
jgi:glucose/arabinose dehydrogenase